MREVVEKLAALGHRRIAFGAGHLGASDRAQQRKRGFCGCMQALGLDDSACLEVPFVETAVQQISDLMRQPDRPTALVCSNDLLAIRSIRAAYIAWLRVPDDSSAMGFNGIALDENLSPRLISVTQPNDALGRTGVKLLVQALTAERARSSEANLLLSYGFRAGKSCGLLVSPK